MEGQRLSHNDFSGFYGTLRLHGQTLAVILFPVTGYPLQTVQPEHLFILPLKAVSANYQFVNAAPGNGEWLVTSSGTRRKVNRRLKCCV